MGSGGTEYGISAYQVVNGNSVITLYGNPSLNSGADVTFTAANQTLTVTMAAGNTLMFSGAFSPHLVVGIHNLKVNNGTITIEGPVLTKTYLIAAFGSANSLTTVGLTSFSETYSAGDQLTVNGETLSIYEVDGSYVRLNGVFSASPNLGSVALYIKYVAPPAPTKITKPAVAKVVKPAVSKKTKPAVTKVAKPSGRAKITKA
jgi:hypothetical protein